MKIKMKKINLKSNRINITAFWGLFLLHSYLEDFPCMGVELDYNKDKCYDTLEEEDSSAYLGWRMGSWDNSTEAY